MSETVIKEKVLNQVLEILNATQDINYNVHELRAFIQKELDDQIQTFCVECKDKKIMQDAIVHRTDSGRSMATGKCPDCGGKVNRIMERDRG